MVDDVAACLRVSWNEVFNSSVVEFLNVTCYIRDKAELEKHQQEQYLNKLKNKKSY